MEAELSKRKRKFKVEIHADSNGRGYYIVHSVDIYNMATKEDIARLLLNTDHGWIDPGSQCGKVEGSAISINKHQFR